MVTTLSGSDRSAKIVVSTPTGGSLEPQGSRQRYLAGTSEEGHRPHVNDSWRGAAKQVTRQVHVSKGCVSFTHICVAMCLMYTGFSTFIVPPAAISTCSKLKNVVATVGWVATGVAFCLAHSRNRCRPWGCIVMGGLMCLPSSPRAGMAPSADKCDSESGWLSCTVIPASIGELRWSCSVVIGVLQSNEVGNGKCIRVHRS